MKHGILAALAVCISVLVPLTSCDSGKKVLKRPNLPDIPEPAPISPPKELAEHTIVFAGYDGPQMVPRAHRGQYVWTALPLEEKKRVFAYVPAVFVENSGANTVVEHLGRRYMVPGAFVNVPPRGVMHPGQAVMMRVSGSFIPARVVSRRSHKYTVAYLWVRDVKTRMVSGTDIAPIPDSMTSGAYGAIRMGAETELGRILASDEKHVWALGFAGRLLRVDRHRVRVLDPSVRMKTGTRVLAAAVGYLRPAKVTKVLAHGAAYEVRFRGQGSTTTVLLPFYKVYPRPRKAKH